MIENLRALGNTDPVQIFHVDAEIPMEGIRSLEALPGHVRVHDIRDVLNRKRGDPELLKYRGFSCLSMSVAVLSSFDLPGGPDGGLGERSGESHGGLLREGLHPAHV